MNSLIEHADYINIRPQIFDTTPDDDKAPESRGQARRASDSVPSINATTTYFFDKRRMESSSSRIAHEKMSTTTILKHD